MSAGGQSLQAVLDGYAKFLREKDLTLPKHQSYLVRWVREFLLFAQDHGGYTFEQTLDLFLAEIGGRVGVKPWQIQQAADAVRIYRYQYRGASDDGEGGRPAAGLNDASAMLVRLREVIRLRPSPGKPGGGSFEPPRREERKEGIFGAVTCNGFFKACPCPFASLAPLR